MSSGGEDFPRSYLIKHCKDDLNALCHITRTPGVAPGTQLDFATELELFLKKQITAISLMENGIHKKYSDEQFPLSSSFFFSFFFFFSSTKTKFILMNQA